ncbi:hypothetical protein [Legionella bononiensis]|uniref:Uncharacterized protein n=1 Tax=Legionella bononiensis TaxID=2793102 RepID=A0ABS1W9S2_9GAMM|nr:hypothetical protein [Legionella bononiensis]MBL7480695.1 hypothetical protein [Legionella bononiensis]MBL7526106.1 hypothetical protein [Legionella bononiensis]MBL7563399.1 hypothetical protein [Legionella bononiensis]
MKKKKILVLTPDTPDPSYIELVVSPLSFLESEYSIHPIDSLCIMEDVPKSSFYQLWAQKLDEYIPQYDAFFGFSFGGVIIQQCFSLFANTGKPIVLFSTPTCADIPLRNKLEEVIALCQNNQVDQALQKLYQHVYYPNAVPIQSHNSLNNPAAAHRVIYGLNRVLETDSTSVVTSCTVNHVHLIGEQSHLVNKDNVVEPKTGTVLQVPKAGMRVLRDNPHYCQAALWEALNA